MAHRNDRRFGRVAGQFLLRATHSGAAEERAAAVGRFADDIGRVEHWTGWDLSAWVAARAAGQ